MVAYLDLIPLIISLSLLIVLLIWKFVPGKTLPNAAQINQMINEMNNYEIQKVKNE